MSHNGFHAHGLHDHEFQHAAEHDPKGLAGQLAVATAIIATVGAIFSYMGGAAQANAGIYKNNAAIKKTEAANQWSFYQAKSSKQNLAEIAIDIVPDARKQFYIDEVKRYKAEKEPIQNEAKKLDAESSEWDVKSGEQLHQHHRWGQATTALQIAIAMAAIALLTRRRWLTYGVFGLSTFGAILGALASFHL
jgi:Na+/glutamate symporter